MISHAPPEMLVFVPQKVQISKIMPKILKFTNYRHSKMKAFLQKKNFSVIAVNWLQEILQRLLMLLSRKQLKL